MVSRRRSAAAAEAVPDLAGDSVASSSHEKLASGATAIDDVSNVKVSGVDKTTEKPLSRRKAKAKKLKSGEASVLEVGDAKASKAAASAATQLSWAPVVQRKASNIPVVFTHDGEFFFVASASAVKIFATGTGRLVSTLSSAAVGASTSAGVGHSATITAMALNPVNVLQLITSSLDGTLKVWDFLDGILVRTVNAGYPITHMALHKTLAGRACVVLRKPRHANEGINNGADRSTSDAAAMQGPCNSIVQVLSLTTAASKNSKSTTPSNIERIGKTRHASGLAISPDGRYIVVVGKRKIHVADTQEASKGFAKILTDHNVTSLAFHPSDNVFATGDEIGRIRLWYFLGDKSVRLSASQQQQTAPSTLLHWHAHAVSALTFTPNGAYLVSGGEESVVVLWQLENLSREYVPRLGGAHIASVSILSASGGGQQEQYVAALGDGSITFIGATSLKPLRTIAGALALNGTSNAKDGLIKSPLAVQPGSGHLVMAAGHPTSLQFVDTDSDEQVMQLEVVPSNRVSRPDEAPIAEAAVEHVAFSSDAAWMATIDARPTGESSLKIWQWDTRKKIYTLNTRIDDSHGQDHQVVSIGFSPRSFGNLDATPLLLTSGSDKKGKLWRCITQDGKRLGQKETFWIARSAFDYRAMTPTCFAWSPDASLLAIAFGVCVTLWEPLTNALLHVVTVPAGGDVTTVADSEGEAVQSIAFAGKGGRYMAATTSTTLTVWDAVLGRPIDECDQNNARSLVSSPDGGFAVVSDASSTSSRIALYPDPSAAEPARVQTLPFRVQRVASASEAGSQQGEATYYVLTGDGDVVKLAMRAKEGATGKINQSARSLHRVSIKRRTLYEELFGTSSEVRGTDVQAPVETSKAPREVPSQTSGLAWAASLFDKPAHLLPPVQSLFEPFMQRMLPQREEEIAKTESKEISNNADVDSNADEENTFTVNLASSTPANDAAPFFDMDIVAAMFAKLASTPEAELDAANYTTATNGNSATALDPATSVTPARKAKSQKGTPQQSQTAQRDAGDEGVRPRSRARKS